MRELTILYDGPALAGKRESIVRLATRFPAARFELLVPEEQVHIPVCVLANEQVSLKVTAHSGVVCAETVAQELRAAADAVVYVIDSQRERWDGNEERVRLVSEPIDARGLPIVWQANKRDLPNRLSMRELARLDRWQAPMFESIANKGIGVWEPFEAIALLLGQRHGLAREIRTLLAL